MPLDVSVNTKYLAVILMTATTVVAMAQEKKPGAPDVELIPEVAKYMNERIEEMDQIPEPRKQLLGDLARFVSQRNAAQKPIKLTFICTHNSRRSHLAQIWAAAAAARFDLSSVESFSGGTEDTAFNPRAVAALRRAGLKIASDDRGENPRYAVTFAENREPLVCYSKVFSSPPNPQSDFCAIMTCSSADRSCPNVHGAAARIAIPYEDPKVADGTAGEAAKYDERCAQICREMLFAFSLVR